jgi:hypothetical protein
MINAPRATKSKIVGTGLRTRRISILKIQNVAVQLSITGWRAGKVAVCHDRRDSTQSGRPNVICFLLDDLANTKKIAVQIDNGKFFEAPRFVF